MIVEVQTNENAEEWLAKQQEIGNIRRGITFQEYMEEYCDAECVFRSGSHAWGLFLGNSKSLAKYICEVNSDGGGYYVNQPAGSIFFEDWSQNYGRENGNNKLEAKGVYSWAVASGEADVITMMQGLASGDLSACEYDPYCPEELDLIIYVTH